MPRRIDIELTSARPDGSWTWRAAGAREPRGVLDGTLVPADARVGAVFKADADIGLDGTSILSVSSTKEKTAKTNMLEILPTDKPFEAVTQQLTGRRSRDDRGDRGDRRDRPSRRPDGDGASRGPRPDRGARPAGDGPRRDRPAGEHTGGPGDPRQDRGPRPGGPRPDRPGGPPRRSGPRFQAPPELPQRPKAKRLKPGRVHRSAVLADLPEEQRAVAERALQGGIPAVRQAVNEQNARLKAEGQPEIPAAGLLNLAEQLLPKLRVAEWLDRADAALKDLEELDLRDLRSVVAAADDSTVARDESTRDVAAKLREALATKQDKEMSLWFGDIEAAIGVGRIVRALKLSSQPPKAGIRFPAELAGKLAATATSSLSVDALPDRWVAVLEAAAFSPIRSHVQPTDKPAQINDELLATVKRVGSLLPHIAALFGVEVPSGGQSPKPLRPTRPTTAKKAPAKATIPPPPAATATATELPVVDAEHAPVDASPSAEVAGETFAGEPAETNTDIDTDSPTLVDAGTVETAESVESTDLEPPAGAVADEPVEISADHEPSGQVAADEPIEVSADRAPAGEAVADEPIENTATAISEHVAPEPVGDNTAQLDHASSRDVSNTDPSVDNDDAMADGAPTTSTD